MNFGIQLYSVKDFMAKDVKSTLAEIGAMGYTVVETAGFFDYSAEDFKKMCDDAGVKVSFVSHYNSKQLPIYSGYKAHGDGVLESCCTSGGGTFANYGATLSDAEIAGVAPELISPDRVANASTCLYKDTTWIVKNAKHVGCKDNSDHTEFAIWLLTRDTQPTVYTDSAYPRFINCDANENFIGF